MSPHRLGTWRPWRNSAPAAISTGVVSSPGDTRSCNVPLWRPAFAGTSEVSLIREEQRRPRQDGGAEIERGEPRDERMHAAQVEQHAEAGRDELGRRERRAEADRADSRGDQRVALDARAPEADPYVCERAVEALHDEEAEDGQVAEQAPVGFPRPGKKLHRSDPGWHELQNRCPFYWGQTGDRLGTEWGRSGDGPLSNCEESVTVECAELFGAVRAQPVA